MHKINITLRANLCQENPDDPACGTGAFEEHEGDHEEGGFWGNEEKATQFEDQKDTFTTFQDNFCEENPDDEGCRQSRPKEEGAFEPGEGEPKEGDHGEGDHGEGDHGGGPPPEGGGKTGGGDNVDCSAYPDDPACNEGYGGPGGTDCSQPGNETLPECGGGSTTFDCNDPANADKCSGSEDTKTGDHGGGGDQGGDGEPPEG